MNNKYCLGASARVPGVPQIVRKRRVLLFFLFHSKIVYIQSSQLSQPILPHLEHGEENPKVSLSTRVPHLNSDVDDGQLLLAWDRHLKQAGESQTSSVQEELVLASVLRQNLRDGACVLEPSQLNIASRLLDGLTNQLC